MTRDRTLFVGLDAACWEYYQPLLDEGALPALQSLIDRGTRGTLRSTVPAWTPTAWATIVTGKNPGKHGVYDMTWLKPGSYGFFPSSARSRFGMPFWTRLNQSGLRVGLVNIPFTYPPDPLDGFVVAGFGAPSGQPDFAWPAEARDWIRTHHPGFQPWVEFSDREERRPGRMAASDVRHQREEVSIALALAEKFQVNVLAINLMAVDHANHWFPGMPGVHTAMVATDRDLQRLLDGFRPDNVVLFSDHGARRVEGDFLLDRWLHEHGYFVQKPRSASGKQEFLNTLLSRYLRNRLKLPLFLEAPVRHLIVSLLPLLSEQFQVKMVARLGDRIPFVESMYAWGELDMEKTPWFAGSPRSGALYVNLAGRQPAGVVPAEEYAAVVEELAERLRGLRDPDGDPIFSGVYRPEQLYEGPATRYAPDLIVESLENAWPAVVNLRRGLINQASVDRYFVRLGTFGDHGQHSRHGLFVFAGRAFSGGGSGLTGAMADLPATLLHLCGVPLPEDWDGEVLMQTLSERLREIPVRRQPGDPAGVSDYRSLYSQEEDAEIFARLQDLGYM